MTFPLTESQIQSAAVDALKMSGWETTVTSQDKPARGGLLGLPDVIAVRDDHVLFIECKTAKGRLRQKQRKWHDRHAPHFGAHVQYIVVRDPADVEAWLGWGRA